MNLISFISENKSLFEILYALIISFICLIITFKTNYVYHLSFHNGLRYFRNSFFFFGIAFLGRHVFGLFSDFSLNYSFIVKILFEYFLIMGGFFLLYSLIWKKFESEGTIYFSSLFNYKIATFHLVALILAVLDILWQTSYFMFFSQIVVFILASIITYLNNKKNGKKRKFLKFYFVATLLGLLAWTFNFLATIFLNLHKELLIDMGLMNIIFFILLLYGVLKVTEK